MNKKIVIIALSLLFSGTLMACPDGSRAEMRKNKIAQTLNLTEDQQVQVEAIMQEKRESIKAAHQIVEQETEAKLAKVLSEEQLQQMSERKRKHHRRMRSHR